MRVNVVSDVHGAATSLARAGDGADALICLGDLIHFIDYDDYSGLMADLFGTEAVATLVELRTAKRFDEARDWSRELWSRLPGDRAEIIDGAIRGQYAEMFAAFPSPTYLTFGNVDLPHLFDDYLRDGVNMVDGQVIELGGKTVGFVGGGLQTPMRTPTELTDEVYAAKVAAVGKVDILCAHIPPEWPWLVYDRLAQRFERGSVALLEAVHATQPEYLLFGHVHNPLAARLRIGRTECINVGHFRATQQPFSLEW